MNFQENTLLWALTWHALAKVGPKQSRRAAGPVGKHGVVVKRVPEGVTDFQSALVLPRGVSWPIGEGLDSQWPLEGSSESGAPGSSGSGHSRGRLCGASSQRRGCPCTTLMRRGNLCNNCERYILLQRGTVTRCLQTWTLVSTFNVSKSSSAVYWGCDFGPVI